MFVPSVCGELEKIRVSITSASETEKLANINPVRRHAGNIAIQMGIVLYHEGVIVWFIIQGYNQFTLLDF